MSSAFGCTSIREARRSSINQPLQAPVDSGGMADVPLDTHERHALCDLLDELGPSVPTLLEGWTAHDLAAHLVLRERDLVAGPCLVLPGPFGRFAERRRARLAESKDFAWLVARIRSGPPIGFFRIGWVRSLANLNEFFVHHEDVRRANRLGPRSLTPAMDAALWRNVRRGSHYLSRRLEACGLEIEWAGTDQRVTVRPGEPTAATQRCAGRTPAIRLWAPGCSAGRGERTTGGRCGGASHALRHVSPSLASIHRSRRYLAGPCWQGLGVTAVVEYIPCWCAGKSGRQSIARLVKGFRCPLHQRCRRAPRLISLSVSIA